MFPGWRAAVITIEIRFCDPASSQKVVILVSSRNRSEDVERCDVGVEAAKNIEVFAHARGGVVRETQDVGKMTYDAVFTAELHDFTVCRRVILRFVRGNQRLTPE